MTEKELKKQSRAELLELLLLQTKESERLRSQLEKAQQHLADRQLQVQEAGNLANAVMAVNGVMEAAQAAAQQYLDNLARMDAQAKARGDKLLEEARQEAGRIRMEAEAIRKDALKLRAEAERFHTEAQKLRSEAENLHSEAASKPKMEIQFPTADDALMEEFYQLLRD